MLDVLGWVALASWLYFFNACLVGALHYFSCGERASCFGLYAFLSRIIGH